MHREHEAAIVELVTQLELADPGARVFTERECRRLERDGDNWSVEVAAEDTSGSRRDRKRWPDVAVDVAGGRRAIEIEFAPKGTARLRGIVRAYAWTYPNRYREVVFFVKNAALGRRIRELGDDAAPVDESVVFRVEPWVGLSAEEQAALVEAMERPTPAQLRARAEYEEAMEAIHGRGQQ